MSAVLDLDAEALDDDLLEAEVLAPPPSARPRLSIAPPPPSSRRGEASPLSSRPPPLPPPRSARPVSSLPPPSGVQRTANAIAAPVSVPRLPAPPAVPATMRPATMRPAPRPEARVQQQRSMLATQVGMGAVQLDAQGKPILPARTASADPTPVAMPSRFAVHAGAKAGELVLVALEDGKAAPPGLPVIAIVPSSVLDARIVAALLST